MIEFRCIFRLIGRTGKTRISSDTDNCKNSNNDQKFHKCKTTSGGNDILLFHREKGYICNYPRIVEVFGKNSSKKYFKIRETKHLLKKHGTVSGKIHLNKLNKLDLYSKVYILYIVENILYICHCIYLNKAKVTMIDFNKIVNKL